MHHVLTTRPGGQLATSPSSLTSPLLSVSGRATSRYPPLRDILQHFRVSKQTARYLSLASYPLPQSPLRERNRPMAPSKRPNNNAAGGTPVTSTFTQDASDDPRVVTRHPVGRARVHHHPRYVFSLAEIRDDIAKLYLENQRHPPPAPNAQQHQ
ncbi:hypothetical protein EJ04DRAFT_596293 [Polyplosphaeria fusca]|uniref:Uncharacterized protein n=1 Tax=Polyplosphaeria fusca TaxID=682080 RepID=A0A9P4QLM9_9PLEO|nr:hypothetical protein EJ04DRAFT_596293 [Polyplosphaeria fusca]